MVKSVLPHCDECTMRKVTLCGAMADAAPKEYAELERTYQEVASRRIVWRAGTVQKSLVVLRAGWAFSYGILNDGRRHIFHFFVPGDTVGLYVDSNAPLPYSIQSLTAAKLCGFEKEEMINRGVRHAAVASGFRAIYLDYVRVLEDRMIYISRYPAAARIASLIVHLRERLIENGLVDGDVMDFPLTQGHVADALGLTAAHVNRMFAELRSQGILTFGAGQLTIHDAARLADLIKSSG